MRFLFVCIIISGCIKKKHDNQYQYVQPEIDWSEDEDIDDLPENDTGL